MAKKRASHIVIEATPKAQRGGWDIEVWCDQAEALLLRLGGVEGLYLARQSGPHAILIQVDARYDVADLIPEIKDIMREM